MLMPEMNGASGGGGGIGGGDAEMSDMGDVGDVGVDAADADAELLRSLNMSSSVLSGSSGGTVTCVCVSRVDLPAA